MLGSPAARHYSDSHTGLHIPRLGLAPLGAAAGAGSCRERDDLCVKEQLLLGVVRLSCCLLLTPVTQTGAAMQMRYS